MVYNISIKKGWNFSTLIYYSKLNIGVDKYLSPVSGNNTTITLPAFSSLLANWIAPYKAAPFKEIAGLTSFNSILYLKDQNVEELYNHNPKRNNLLDL